MPPKPAFSRNGRGQFPKLQAHAIQDSVVLDREAVHCDEFRICGQIKETSHADAARAHARNIVVDDSHIAQIAIGNREKRLAHIIPWGRRIGINPDATVFVHSD
jgi:hypothetical protein